MRARQAAAVLARARAAALIRSSGPPLHLVPDEPQREAFTYYVWLSVLDELERRARKPKPPEPLHRLLVPR